MGDTLTPEGHVDEVGCWCGPTVHPVSGLGHTLAVTAPVDRPGGAGQDVAAWAEELWHRAIDSDSESGPRLLANALRRAAETDDAAARNAPAWVQAVTPAEIVRQRTRGWPDFHPEDFCHRCGRRNPCWFADTELWQVATGSTGDGGGILCPGCFAELWQQKTGRTGIIWRFSIDPRSRDAARVDEGRWTVAEEVVSRYFDRSDDEWGQLRTDVAEALAGNITGAARVDENPYMLDNTPEELERVKRIAAERHHEEAAQIAARVNDPAAAVKTRRCSMCGAADHREWAH